MSTAFTKPENALKRAEELLNVGQNQEAWDTIHRVITSRRYRAWNKTLERIMFKYIDLCVEMRKGAREGLNQYRIMCQQVNVSSLEEVIKHFMQLSSEKADVARSKADALEVTLDVDDLEADKRPEDLMLSYVSGQKEKDRSDRELVTPALKYLWETYKTVLEVLRNNSKLETLYAMTARCAFQFCKQYKRSTEFRRLCELIRNHLVNLNKYRDQRDRPDVTAPETQQLYLDTRFDQLKVATELELWQEAFRSVEDIYGFMCMVKKQPKASLLVVYYAKLTEIFWISSSLLHHAYAWLKLFSLQKSFNKNLTQKDLQLIASSVVLAALSVPNDPADTLFRLELEVESERSLKMANLIGFNLDNKREGGEMLSRASLLTELVAKGILTCVSQEVKDLFYLLEHEFLPLDLASRVQPLLTKISKLNGKLSFSSSVHEVQFSQYVPALEKQAALRLLKQVSQVYHSLSIESLSKMIPFLDFTSLEKISVDSVKMNFLSMKVDHLRGAVVFGTLGLESDDLRDQLVNFSESLNKSRAMIYPAREKASKLEGILPGLSEIVEKEHKRLLARKSIIENRKEEQERLLLEMEKEEESKRLKLQKLAEEAEKKRIASEVEQRKHERILRERKQRELEESQVLIDAVEKRSKKKGKKLVIDGDVTKEGLLRLEMNEQLKEKQELEKRLQKQGKIMDYLERAKREETTPLIESAYQLRLVEEQMLHEQEQLQEIEQSQLRHDKDLQEKNRLARMLEQKVILQDRVMSRRQAEFDRLMAERTEKINSMLQQRRQEIEVQRKMMFYISTERQRLEKLQQEEEARKLEEAERVKKEAAERKAKYDETLAIQMQRDKELEEKAARLKREALLGQSSEAPRLVRPLEAATPAPAAIAAAETAGAPAQAAAPGKYVPKWKRGGASSAGPTPTAPDSLDRRGTSRPGERRPGYGFGRS